MPWVTINGNHVLIGEDDGSGPGKTEMTLGKAVLEMRLQDARAPSPRPVPKAGT